MFAELLHRFDLIAITELRRDVSDLHRVMVVLGAYWRVVYSDFTADWSGNRERSARARGTQWHKAEVVSAGSKPVLLSCRVVFFL